MNKLEQAARALLAHWDTPAWKYLKPTGDLMADLREALAEQAKQDPECKALRMAEEALVYHTEQTRPIQKTDEAIIYLRNVIAKGVSNMTFTLEDAITKYPEISYWHSEFLKCNTISEQAEQEPIKSPDKGLWTVKQWGTDKVVLLSGDFTHDVALAISGDFLDIEQRLDYALNLATWMNHHLQNIAPVRTKDLTDAEIATLVQRNTIDGKIMPFALCEAVIAADREKNRG